MNSFDKSNNESGDQEQALELALHLSGLSEIVVSQEGEVTQTSSHMSSKPVPQNNISTLVPQSISAVSDNQNPRFLMEQNMKNQNPEFLMQQNMKNQDPRFLVQHDYNQNPGCLMEQNMKNQNPEFLVQQNINRDVEFLIAQNKKNQNPRFVIQQNQEVMVAADSVDERLDNKAALDTVEEKLQDSPTTSRTRRVQKSKSCAVLLGRGNSFSLGRSEVILLNTRRRRRANTGSVTNLNRPSSLDESTNFENNNMQAELRTDNDMGQLGLDVTLPRDETHSSPEVLRVSHDLETLWQRVESIMSAKQSVVQQVLEDFGISDSRQADEEDMERLTEEETVWQAVQDNFQL